MQQRRLPAWIRIAPFIPTHWTGGLLLCLIGLSLTGASVLSAETDTVDEAAGILHLMTPTTDPLPQTVATATIANHPGKALFDMRCSSCHAAPQPQQYSMQEWTGILQRMAPRSAMRATEITQVTAYLQLALTQTPADASTPATETDIFKELEALPDT